MLVEHFELVEFYQFYECSTNIPSGLSAYKPLELVAYFVFIIITCGLFLLHHNTEDVQFFRHNKPQLIDQSERAQ